MCKQAPKGCGDSGINVGADGVGQRGWKRRGQFEYYWFVYDPYRKDDVVGGSLSDDLLDVYKDLKRALLVYDRGTPESVRDAVRSWRDGFASHWGNHALGALRALYWIMTRYHHNDDITGDGDGV